MVRASLGRAAALGALLLLLGACTSPPPPAVQVPQPQPSAPPPPSRAAQPLQLHDATARCASLPSLDRPGLEIQRAELIAEGVSQALDPISRRSVGPPLPEHCRVEGRLQPRTDADAVPAVDFEMRLPSRWNGRFLFQGSFELRPRAVEAFGRTTGAGGMEDNALSQGYAVLAGHAGGRPGAASSGRAEADTDAALEPAAAAARALIEGYYGRPADRSYFVGCSAGGREGLVFAQRWPQTFDGVVAVAPLLREADAALAAAWTMQRFLAVAPRARPGQRVLSRAFTVEDLFVVADAVLKQCDALDGAEDGFVMDMAGCRFDPAALACKRRNTKSCLPRAKVQALAEAMRGPRDAAGGALYAPWPWDPGIAAPGWRAWTLGSAGPGAAPNPLLLALTAPLLQPHAAGRPSSARDSFALDIDRDRPRLQAQRGADEAFMSAPLDGFRRGGSKLLLVHGAADPVVSAWATVDYQRRLDAASPPGAEGAGDFARTFVVPGMNHCAGGPSLDRFDALAALVDWVEQERPPRRIEARGSAVLRDETRPLCPWPQVARYGGAGSVHDSAGYECR
jgi:feruloyl esterase